MDLAVTNRRSGSTTVMDVVVSHSVMGGDPKEWKAHGGVEKAAGEKHKVYAKWNVNRKDVVPLSFSTYNAWAKETHAYIKGVTKETAAGSKVTAGRLFRAARLVVARAIVRGQGRLLMELNRRNGARRLYHGQA